MSRLSESVKERLAGIGGAGGGGPHLRGRLSGDSWQAPANYVRTTGSEPPDFKKIGLIAGGCILIFALGYGVGSLGKGASSTPVTTTPTTAVSVCTGKGASTPTLAVAEFSRTVQVDGGTAAALDDLLKCVDPTDRVVYEAEMHAISGLTYSFSGSLTLVGQPTATSPPAGAVPGTYEVVHTTGTVKECIEYAKKTTCQTFTFAAGASASDVVRVGGAWYIFGGGSAGTSAAASPTAAP
jgi:hypothetical protein